VDKCNHLLLRRRTGRTHTPRCAPDRSGQPSAQLGHAASMLFTVSWVLCPVIQLVACFQKALEPTAAGIWSLPSKRNTAFGSCSSCAASRSIGFLSLLMSSFLLALTQPPWPSGALMFAQTSVDR